MVRSGPVVLDTNVAALLVVGRAGRDLIARHKRTDTFTIADFEALEELLERVTHAVCLPHVLSELSNLLKAGRRSAGAVCAVQGHGMGGAALTAP